MAHLKLQNSFFFFLAELRAHAKGWHAWRTIINNGNPSMRKMLFYSHDVIDRPYVRTSTPSFMPM